MPELHFQQYPPSYNPGSTPVSEGFSTAVCKHYYETITSWWNQCSGLSWFMKLTRFMGKMGKNVNERELKGCLSKAALTLIMFPFYKKIQATDNSKLASTVSSEGYIMCIFMKLMQWTMMMELPTQAWWECRSGSMWTFVIQINVDLGKTVYTV